MFDVGGGSPEITHLDSVLGQLVRVGGADNAISLNASVSDLGGDVPVGQTHNQTVLGSVVLVLVLEDQALASIVVGLSLTTPLELNLVPLEVLLVLHNFYETLNTTKSHIISHIPIPHEIELRLLAQASTTPGWTNHLRLCGAGQSQTPESRIFQLI